MRQPWGQWAEKILFLPGKNLEILIFLRENISIPKTCSLCQRAMTMA